MSTHLGPGACSTTPPITFTHDTGAYEGAAPGGFNPGNSRAAAAPRAAGGGLFAIMLAAQSQATTTTITYTYDLLYRLTRADYSDGRYFVYTYDSVGNRLTEEKCVITPCGTPITNTYTYDSANRLASVNGQTYTWDNNGNLLNDGTSTYAYDAANRLKSVTQGTTLSSYSYNGLGDRLSQTVNSATTNYVLDLNAGLTQVLSDGTNTYLYGNGRIGELQSGGFAYHLGDALGSVRQLTDAGGGVTLARSFEPYGNTLTTNGTGSTIYQYTGEVRDASGLTFLRARYLSGNLGRFTSKDTWRDYYRPLTLNGWGYVEDNPINLKDPSGQCVNPNGTTTWWKWPFFDWGPCPLPPPTITLATSTPVRPDPGVTIIPGACPTPGSTSTPQPPQPTATATATATATPYPVPLSTFSVFPGDTASLVTPFSLQHQGVDIVPTSYRGGGNDAMGTPVYALYGGFVTAPPNANVGPFEVIVTDNNRAFDIGYFHVVPTVVDGSTINAGTEVGTLVDKDRDPKIIGNSLAHLHLQLRVPANAQPPTNPSFMIIGWGPPFNP